MDIKIASLIDIKHRNQLIELGEILNHGAQDIETKVGNEKAYDILDLCFKKPELCDHYIEEIRKSSNQRNLSLNEFVDIQSQVSAKFSYGSNNIPKPTPKANDLLPFLENAKQPSVDYSASGGLQFESEIKAKFENKVPRQAFEKSVIKASKALGTGEAVVAGASAITGLLANSNTLDKSLDNVKYQTNKEEFNAESFDSNEKKEKKSSDKK